MAKKNGTPGPGVDASGREIRDPSGNVLDLVEAAIQRQDDLRQLETKWRDKMDTLTAQHTRDMRQAESDRIDAIRAVDVGNVQRAAEVQATQALALANQVVATATALETKLGATVAPLQTRIDDLTRVQYEGVGQKGQVAETQAKGASTGMWIGIVIAAVGLFIAFAAIATTIVIALTH